MLYAIIAIILLVLVIVGLIWYYHQSNPNAVITSEQNKLTQVVKDVAASQVKEAQTDALHAASTTGAVLLNELHPTDARPAGPVSSPRVSGFSPSRRN